MPSICTKKWEERKMWVGEKVEKFTWMMDNVEIQGRVRQAGSNGQSLPDGVVVGDVPDFSIEPDPNYRHLVSFMRGNKPLIWYNKADNPSLMVMHCETYPLPADQI